MTTWRVPFASLVYASFLSFGDQVGENSIESALTVQAMMSEGSFLLTTRI